MSIVTYDPFRTLAHFDKRFRNFDSYFRPDTDLYENDNEFIVKVDLPGFTKDQISVNATHNVLEVKTEIVKESTEDKKDSEVVNETKEYTPRHIERVSRNYYRKIKFNKPIDTKNAKVSLENGVLTISLPISQEAKKIALNIA